MQQLRALRLRQHLTQKQVAERLGVDRTTYNKYETGASEPNLQTLRALSSLLGVSMDELTAQGEPPARNLLPLPKVKRYPLLGSIACGQPILADENIEEYVAFPEEIQADFCLRCQGDSMIGAGIRDGSIVFIRQTPDVNNGEIAAVLIEEEATLKRVYRRKGQLILQPENPAYEPLVYMGEELAAVRILGKAVAYLNAVL